ncbi:MAG TPA: Nramp family divalent metal transporter [Actinocrinis sp.]|uniref:Nramp family divalent metal transporter n=1 Tax=Actinocrinis sp. TaxID=1920516 RepID=UPI002DDCA7A7|nr:Nramp family divalent metal transporter [Actinocrinis sp.]HEV2346174.1 Nramp family divalent metal transporter [Actinocrinis sp.]
MSSPPALARASAATRSDAAVRLRHTARYLGPAGIAAVAYIDPGNFATNTAAGARYGFTLLWVVVAANLVAMLVQYLSAKLGIATGMSLPEMCRHRLGRRLRIGLWLQAEFVVIVTDLAEVIGGALGLQLLFHTPPWLGGLLTGAAMMLVLLFTQQGRRRFEAVIIALVVVVLVAFAYQALNARVNPAAAIRGLVPTFRGGDSVLLAAGIVGATVMPHAIYLHSALARDIAPTPDTAAGVGAVSAIGAKRRAVRMTLIDVTVALGVAALINAAMLLAATPLAGTGATSIPDAYNAFKASSGAWTATVFGIALLASGLASSCVGVYSGQVVMQGFLHRSMPLWQRRLISLVPALAALAFGLDPTTALVVSQVVVSFGVPFAMVPLLVFTSDRRLMGALANRPGVVAVAVAATVLITALNAWLIVSSLS